MNIPVSAPDSLPLTSAETVCPLDCADTCSLKVDIDGDQVTRVRGSKRNEFTDGKICTKVATGMVEWVHGDKRVLTPLRRIGGKGEGRFEAISWDQAYAEIKQRFDAIIRDHGSQAIVPLSYGGPMGMLSGGSMDERFFNRLGASQLDSAPLCAGVSTAAWESVLGDVGGIAHPEMEHSKLIVVWANNITVGHLHMIKRYRKAQANGARLVVIDPKRIRIADEADLFLQINPGTDVVLAYAVAALIEEMGGLNREFIDSNVSGADAYLKKARSWTLAQAAEICGLGEDEIRQFASYWCEIKPASLSMGVALERSRNGGSAIRAAMALPLLSGNFGPQGAGICDSSSYFDIDRAALKRPDWIKPGTRTLNILDLGQHIVNNELDIPIKALFFYNHNPVAVHPRQKLIQQALCQEDLFVVGYDLSMTDSMNCADIVLPACSPLEYGDLYKSYGHSTLQRSAAVIAPVGESRPNTQVFRELAQVFGFNDPEFQQTDEQMLSSAVDHLIEVGAQEDRALDGRGEVVFRDLPPATESGKALLFNPEEEIRAGLGLPGYQPLPEKRRFTLVSPGSDKRTNSTFGGTAANSEPYAAEIHADDARECGLTDGQRIKLVNQQAEVVLNLHLSDRVKPGLVYVPKGAWNADSESGITINALIPGHKADMADGACYNDAQVDILPA